MWSHHIVQQFLTVAVQEANLVSLVKHQLVHILMRFHWPKHMLDDVCAERAHCLLAGSQYCCEVCCSYRLNFYDDCRKARTIKTANKTCLSHRVLHAQHKIQYCYSTVALLVAI